MEYLVYKNIQPTQKSIDIQNIDELVWEIFTYIEDLEKKVLFHRTDQRKVPGKNDTHALFLSKLFRCQATRAFNQIHL